MLRQVERYNPGAVLVFDLDIGHTDPQFIVPIGGLARIDPSTEEIWVRY